MNITNRKSSVQSQYTPGAPKGRRILELTTKEKIHFVASFDYVMASGEGVIWKFHKELPNVGQAVMLLKKAGKKFKVVTDDSQHTDDEFESLLANVGINDVKSEDIICPAKTIVRYLKKFNKQNYPIFSICNAKSNNYFDKMNINVITLESIIKANKYEETTTSLTYNNVQKIITPQEKINIVVVDHNYNLTYAHIAAAQQYLFNPNCSLIVGAFELDNPVVEGFNTLGNAGVLNILQDGRNKDAVLLGTQGTVLGDELADQFRIVDPKRVLFVGNTVLKDIQFATRCGFQTLFVFTGKSQESDLMDLPQDLKPDYMTNSLGDFVRIFEELHN